MVLYTCGQKERGGSVGHPCGRAINSLDKAGYDYELKVLGGYRLMPWTWKERNVARQEVERLSGTKEVPVLVLDDGAVVSGSGTIALWAREHPAAR